MDGAEVRDRGEGMGWVEQASPSLGRRDHRGWHKGRAVIVENKHQSSLCGACGPGIVLYNVGTALYVFRTAILGCNIIIPFDR